MNDAYSIDQPTKTLFFTGKPKSLNEYSVKKKDKETLTSIVIPKFVSFIGDYVFQNCSNLASVHIPNSVSTVDWCAFHNCTSLASMHIPNSVSVIGNWCFDNCSALTSVYVSNSVATIDYGAFRDCSALAYIHIPNSVKNIGDYTFSACRHLHKACIPISSKLLATGNYNATIPAQTSILRPRLQPITTLQKRSACRANKSFYSVYL